MTICKACRDRRCHTELEKRKFHPLMGHGYAPETGWTHPEAKRLHDQKVIARAVPKVGTTNVMGMTLLQLTPEAKHGA
jgi:hypothetical protein